MDKKKLFGFCRLAALLLVSAGLLAVCEDLFYATQHLLLSELVETIGVPAALVVGAPAAAGLLGTWLAGVLGARRSRKRVAVACALGLAASLAVALAPWGWCAIAGLAGAGLCGRAAEVVLFSYLDELAVRSGRPWPRRGALIGAWVGLLWGLGWLSQQIGVQRFLALHALIALAAGAMMILVCPPEPLGRATPSWRQAILGPWTALAQPATRALFAIAILLACGLVLFQEAKALMFAAAAVAPLWLSVANSALLFAGAFYLIALLTLERHRHPTTPTRPPYALAILSSGCLLAAFILQGAAPALGTPALIAMLVAGTYLAEAGVTLNTAGAAYLAPGVAATTIVLLGRAAGQAPAALLNELIWPSSGPLGCAAAGLTLGLLALTLAIALERRGPAALQATPVPAAAAIGLPTAPTPHDPRADHTPRPPTRTTPRLRNARRITLLPLRAARPAIPRAIRLQPLPPHPAAATPTQLKHDT